MGNVATRVVSSTLTTTIQEVTFLGSSIQDEHHFQLSGSLVEIPEPWLPLGHYSREMSAETDDMVAT